MADNTTLSDPLARILETYCNVNAISVDRLKINLKSSIKPVIAKSFKEQFSNAILQSSITPEIYEELTGEDFDTQEDLTNWLRELWSEIFDDEPIPSDL